MSNIYEKIQIIKEELLKANLKKSGENKFAGYKYYELADFLPTIISLCKENKIYTQISFDSCEAVLKAINIEKPEEEIEITSPMVDLELKGCNKVQALGGTETYQRRYLYMNLFDIVENDMFDSTINDIQTKEEAEKYTLTFGKHQGRTIKDLVENEPKYIDWLLKNSNDSIVLKCIELITGQKPLTESEQDEHLNLTGELQNLIVKYDIDLDTLLKHYKVANLSELSMEQYKNAIDGLKKKYEA